MWESKAASSRAGTDALATHTRPLGAPSPRDVFTHPPSMQGHGEGLVRFWEADRMEGTRCVYTPVRELEDLGSRRLLQPLGLRLRRSGVIRPDF